MATEIIFPRVDMDMASGRFSRWLAREGDAVAKGDPLFEIETDKAAMEIDAPASGILRGVRAAQGEEVAVGAAVGWIVAEGEAWEDPAFDHADRGTRALPDPVPDSVPYPVPEAAAMNPQATSPAGVVDPPAVLLRATPLARREATRLAIDLHRLQGSGPRGRIRAADLPGERAAALLPDAVPPAARRTGLHREWRGQPKRPADLPLVFLHGFGSDLTGWRAVSSPLEDGHRLLLIDLPGHGRSEAAGAVGFDDLVDAVQAVLDEENVPRCVLVGHSLGGAVALGLLEVGSVEIGALCLVAPAGLGPEMNGGVLSGLLRARSEASLAPWLRQLFADPAIVTPAYVRAALRGRTGDHVACQQRLAEAVFPDGTQGVSLRHVLPRVVVPAKVIWGTQDAIIPARHAMGLPGRIALHRVEAGHMPHVEAPPLVSALIAELARSAST